MRQLAAGLIGSFGMKGSGTRVERGKFTRYFVSLEFVLCMIHDVINSQGELNSDIKPIIRVVDP